MKSKFLQLLASLCLIPSIISCEEALPEPIAVTSVSLNATSMELIEGEIGKLVATVSPNNADNKLTIWSSSNMSVAMVENGVVTAIKSGKALITVKTDDAGKTATCDLTVLPRKIPVSSVSMDKEVVEMVEGDKLTLNAMVYPENASNKDITWNTNNSHVASVDKGVVTALKPGKATIIVKTVDGSKVATCTITVSPKTYSVEGISLDKTSVEVVEGGQIQIVATIAPSNATNKNVTWSSSDESVARVNDGLVTALKPGNTIISVKTEDGSKTASCSVKVVEQVYPVTHISLDKEQVEIVEGDKIIVNATIYPSNATNKNVTWKSSDTTIATVSDGEIAGLSPGHATIIVSTEDGGKTAMCNVLVKARTYPVSGVSLDKREIEMVEGDSFALRATIFPDNATNKNVFWKSSDESICSVDGGVIWALKSGKAIVSVITEDGGKIDRCSVKVKEPPMVESINLSHNLINGYIYRDHSRMYKVTASIMPGEALADLEWTSSDIRVAKVEVDGMSAKIYTEDYGESVITVYDKRSGLSASMTIFTIVEDFVWKESSAESFYGYPLITICEEDKYQLKYSYSPSSATRIFYDLSQVVFYENDAVVETPTNISLSEDGVVTGLREGVTGIKVTGRIVKGSSEPSRVYFNVTKRHVPVSGIKLNKTSLSMTQYDTEKLIVTISPSNATNKNVVWTTSDDSVAIVDEDGMVRAVGGGNATITVKTEDEEKLATCRVAVIPDSHEAVDLGLSVKWATCNFNAASSHEIGGYYLWGDPTGNAEMGFNYIGGEIYPLYNAPNMDEIGGTSYDIVRSKWGGKWRLPNMKEFRELYSKCKWEYTSQSGVYGIKITGPNGNSIFLPMTGYAYPDDGPVGAFGVTDSESGYYMTSQSYKDEYGRFAYSCQIKSNKSYSLPSWRVGFAGMAIRPVR